MFSYRNKVVFHSDLTGCNITLNVTDTKQYVMTEPPLHGSCSVNFVAPPGEEALIVFEDVYLGMMDSIVLRKFL